MRKNLIFLFMALLFAGLSLNASALKEGESLRSFSLEDQFGKKHSLEQETQKMIFAFSKESGHKCNDFFSSQDSSYLSSRQALFVADISAAPSLVQMLFIKPGLRDFKHRVLVLDDEALAKRYKTDHTEEKIVVAELQHFVITKLLYFDTIEELKNYLQ